MKIEQMGEAIWRWLLPHLQRRLLRNPTVASFYSFFTLAKEAYLILEKETENLKYGKITLLAKGDSAEAVETVLRETSLFDENEKLRINTLEELDQATGSMAYVIVWDDWCNEPESITRIIEAKQADAAGLVVFAPKTGTPVGDEDKKRLLDLPNVIITRRRGHWLKTGIVMVMNGAYAGNTEDSHPKREGEGDWA